MSLRLDGSASDELLIASESQLLRFHLGDHSQSKICDLEADNPITRSNDGRCDPQGGFWIGTMGKKAEAKAGAIYRYYRGDLVQLFSEITIPNAICFAPDGQTAYFTDTPLRQILAVDLDAEGWPCSAAARGGGSDSNRREPRRCRGGCAGQYLERAMGRGASRLL